MHLRARHLGVCLRAWLGALGVLAFAASPLAAQRPPAADSVLDIAVEDDADIWSRADGTGFANDVVRAAFQAAGVGVRLHVVPYARCKQQVVDAAVVACFSMSQLPALAVPEQPLFVYFSDYFRRAGGPPLPATPDRLPHGTTVGVVLGYEYPASVYDLELRGVIRLESSPSEAVNLRKLAAGRVDLAIVNHNETKPDALLLARAGVTATVERTFRAGVLPSFLGFSRAHPRTPWAMARFTQGMRIIAANGTLRRIQNRWANEANAVARSLRVPAR
jgi:ABC-type amino acid transport substrate-binding protein